jgi:cell division protease FtsH
MVTAFGMSEMGPWALMEPAAQSGDVVLRMLARNSVSENLAADIDDQAYDVAKEHVRRNRAAIYQLVDVVMETETLTGDEFRAIFSEHVGIGKEQRETAARRHQQSWSPLEV